MHRVHPVHRDAIRVRSFKRPPHKEELTMHTHYPKTLAVAVGVTSFVAFMATFAAITHARADDELTSQQWHHFRPICEARPMLCSRDWASPPQITVAPTKPADPATVTYGTLAVNPDPTKPPYLSGPFMSSYGDPALYSQPDVTAVEDHEAAPIGLVGEPWPPSNDPQVVGGTPFDGDWNVQAAQATANKPGDIGSDHAASGGVGPGSEPVAEPTTAARRSDPKGEMQSRSYYDGRGSFAGSSVTRGNSSSIYDRNGHFKGSAIRNNNGTTSVYDRNGHFTGSVVNTGPRR
jgi:hypothetical protein